MKKIFVASLCALGVLAASVIALNGENAPVYAFGGGFGIEIK